MGLLWHFGFYSKSLFNLTAGCRITFGFWHVYCVLVWFYVLDSVSSYKTSYEAFLIPKENWPSTLTTSWWILNKSMEGTSRRKDSRRGSIVSSCSWLQAVCLALPSSPAGAECASRASRRDGFGENICFQQGSTYFPSEQRRIFLD